MTPELKLQMDRQKALTGEIIKCLQQACEEYRATIQAQNSVIRELKVQLRTVQDELYSETVHPLGPDYRPDLPWTSDDNGAYARGIRS